MQLCPVTDMPANLTFFTNDSNRETQLKCYQINPYLIVLPTIDVTIYLFLVPFFLFVIHHGLQQWMKKTSFSSSAAAMSHSDCFTYNMVLVELVDIVGHVIYYCGILLHNDEVKGIGDGHRNFSWMCKMLLQLLTCVERYLAVVHPITYMRLKNRKGTRIRNATIVCVWLISGAFAHIFEHVLWCLLLVSLAAVCFFSISVLVVLVRPGPGEQGGNRQWADPSKKRAFFTIVAILGVLVLRILGDLAWKICYEAISDGLCVAEVYLAWMKLPNSLVLPLLFLLKHGRSK